MIPKRSNFKAIKKYLIRTFIAPILIRLLKTYLRLVFFSSHVEIDNIKEFDECTTKPSVVLLWHHNIILAPHVIKYCYKGERFMALSSQHQDGKLLKDFIKLYGYDTISGSARHGGISAARAMLAALKMKSEAPGFSVITAADGPIGPPMVAKPGMLLLAFKNGASVASLYIASSKSRFFRTWDRMMIPLPFSVIKCRFKVLWQLPATTDHNKNDWSKVIEMIQQQMVDDAICLQHEVGCHEYDRKPFV